MSKKLYVGNLPYSTDDAELESQFASFGVVTSARVITDRESGRSKGFGFVEMENDQDAIDAIEKLNGTPVGGRNLTVSEARPQEPREGGRGPRGGGGGGGRGGFRGGPGGGGNRY